MRTTLYLLLCAVAFGVTIEAQQPRDPRSAATQILMQLERLEAEAAVRVAELRRDAFIVAQLAGAAGDLRDFQKNIAIQKALDRVEAAGNRAVDKPVAHPEVLRLLSAARARLEQAREQGSSADFPALERDLSRISSEIQPYVFRDILEMQKLRLALGDIQSRVGRMTQDLDAATGEVLASTLEQTRVGD